MGVNAVVEDYEGDIAIARVEDLLVIEDISDLSYKFQIRAIDFQFKRLHIEHRESPFDWSRPGERSEESEDTVPVAEPGDEWTKPESLDDDSETGEYRTGYEVPEGSEDTDSDYEFEKYTPPSRKATDEDFICACGEAFESEAALGDHKGHCEEEG